MTTLLRRALPALGLIATLLSAPARAEDTKPPQFGNVSASAKGGKVNITAKISDETGVLEAKVYYRKPGDSKYDEAKLVNRGGDDFAASFDFASSNVEYYLTAVDELGNGPSKYGEPNNPKTIGKGDRALASNDEPKKRKGRGRRKKTEVAEAEKPAEPAAEEKPAEPAAEEKPAEESKGPPAIEHEKPADAKEGAENTLAVKITGNKIVTAFGYFRAKGQAKFAVTIPLTNKEGDQWEAVVPANFAKGTIEYLFSATDEKKRRTTQGDGAPNKPFSLEFKKGGAGEATASAGGDGYLFAHKPVVRASPGVNINIRAQATPDKEADAPTKMMLLVRDGAGVDKQIDLAADESGGIGGFSGQIPAQGEGALYYQIVACKEAKCGIDTGTKKNWHAVAVSNDAEAKLPEAIDAVSSKAPAGLPE